MGLEELKVGWCKKCGTERRNKRQERVRKRNRIKRKERKRKKGKEREKERKKE